MPAEEYRRPRWRLQDATTSQRARALWMLKTMRQQKFEVYNGIRAQMGGYCRSTWRLDSVSAAVDRARDGRGGEGGLSLGE